MSNEKIKILLVDDHTILRQGMRQLLETFEQLNVCGEAGDGQEAIVQALSLKPDVILMDINLPKLNGYESSQSILTAWPEANILMLTNQDDPNVLKKCLDLDIRGFLLKDVEVDDLVVAIEKAIAGETIELSSELAEKLSDLKVKSEEKVHLTEREQEVLKALAKGFSNQELAEQFVVSPKTIHNHLYNIYSKINASSRSEAIVWAISNGLNE